VSLPKNTSIPDTVLPTTLNTITPFETANNTRELALYEEEDSYGRLIQNLGTLAGPAAFDSPITEVITQGDTEIWKIYNTTADTHPIHLHQVTFQIISRQKFNWKETSTDGITVTALQGQPRGPDANEAGWKDTVRMNPGEVTIIEAKFDVPGKYVWHCHILEHEEHDMMRFFEVIPSAAATTTSATLAASSTTAFASSTVNTNGNGLLVTTLGAPKPVTPSVAPTRTDIELAQAASALALRVRDEHTAMADEILAAVLDGSRPARRLRERIVDQMFAQFDQKPLDNLLDALRRA